MKKIHSLILLSLVCLNVEVIGASANEAIQVNFTGTLTKNGFVGPDSINPFLEGNALSTFIQSSGETDVVRVDGQFYMSDWDGSDGTFTSNVTPGVRFFLHSPLLERLEADTWRAEGESSVGTLTGLGDPISQRKKFLLPTANTFGVASLTIKNGLPIELSYSLDFAESAAPGFENTALESVEFTHINLNSEGANFGSGQNYQIGIDDDNVQFGFNTSLTAGSHPSKVLNGTVVNTTRGMLRDEINSNTDEIGGNTPNISSTGRLNGGEYPSGAAPSEGDVYLEDPFAAQAGTLTVYETSGLNIEVVARKSALEFDTPIWASHENAESYGWQSFTNALGEPGNAPDMEGSSSGPEIVQSVPGAIVAGSGNLYNAASTSMFTLTQTSSIGLQNVILQVKSSGEIASESVRLNYSDSNGANSLQPSRSIEIARKVGMWGSATIMSYYYWSIPHQTVKNISIDFNANGPHFSLDEVRLDTLGETASPAGAIQINFTGTLNERDFDGPNSISPFVEGNALSAFIASSGETDVVRVDGQFYMSDWDGSDGTFTSNVTPGVRFFLHSPLLERLEADTWRAEGESSVGTLTGLGDPISQRKKFLLPTANTFGIASLKIENGLPVSLNYSLDFEASGAPSFDGTNLEQINFKTITLDSDGADFGIGETFSIGVDDADVPFGFNTSLTAGSHPSKVLNGTVTNTTRGTLRAEINSNTDEVGGSTPNISSNGRLNGGEYPSGDSPSEGDVYLADPFSAQTGALTVFDATELNVGISVTPQPTPAPAGVLQVNFTGTLAVKDFDGPNSISPFVSGNALSDFIERTGEMDVLRVDGQFYMSDWDGSDGTFTSNNTPGVKFFLHSPLLERLEADTWRAEGESSAGTLTGLGDAISQRKKFLLPTASTYGIATLTVENGVPVDLTYSLDFADSDAPGFEGTNLEQINFKTITLNSQGSDFGIGQSFEIGVNDDDVAYGFNTSLTPGSHPSKVLNGTVTNTTRGILRAEINSNSDEVGGSTPNISSNGRLNGGEYPDGSSPSEGDVYLADPFVTESGSLTVFNTSDINIGISVEPQPTPAPAGVLQVNFTATLSENGFSGPSILNPFISGNALSTFIESTSETDVLRVDGQFYMSGWDGSDGIFNSEWTPGVKFFLHSPLLERLEADTWRAEGESNSGTLTGLGNPISQRKKFLLPKADTYGVATLTVKDGVPVSLNYSLDFETSGAPGFEGTNLESVNFRIINLDSKGADFGIGQTFEIGVNDDDVPFGFNTSLTAGSHPEKVLNGTVVNTTRGIIRKELYNNTDELGGNSPNISSNGRLNGGDYPSGTTPSLGDAYLADPFAGEEGFLTLFNAAELNISVVAESRAPAGALQVNFTGTLNEGGFNGPASISPFVSGNALSAFIESTSESDVLRVDGQFYISDWDGSDGTFTSNETPGVRFFLHSPLLERLEADTWRAEGGSNIDTLTGLGNPISQRKKFLLPTANTYGSASLTIENGVPVSLTYSLDFAASGAPGFEGTNLDAVQFNLITLDSEDVNFGVGETFVIGVNDDDVPFGFNTSLSAGSHPEKVLNGTVVDTTRGMLRQEISANTDEKDGNTPNISSNGRLDGDDYPSGAAPSDGDVYLADPFAGQSGVLTVFNPSELNVGVQAELKSASEGAIQINFTGTLSEGDFIGPDSISPFISGNALSAFIERTGETDVLRVDGQFYMAEWDGSDGTFISNETPGVRFFLHSPLLERLEADTWRAEGESNSGTLTGLNDPISQRKKFLLPTANTFGTAKLTIENGNPVSLSYSLDFAATGAPGFEGTNLESVQFNVINLNSDGVSFGIGQTYEVGVNDDAVPFGFNTSLTAGSHPEKVLNGTVVDLTRGMLRDEIGSNVDELGGNTPNISSNGRLNGIEHSSGSAPSDGDVYLADPFAGQTGFLTVFSPTELKVIVQAEPKPTSAPAGAIQVNFTGTLNENNFIGPDSINPFVSGNALSAFIESTGETDVLRVDGQFYMADWDGTDGTFTSNQTPGTRFFLHSPLLERIEADTWRAEGESNAGTLTGLGNPISQRKKFLLPTANTYGIASLTIENGLPVSLTYSLDFAASGAPGFEGTNLEAVDFQLITLNSEGVSFGAGETFEVGVNDDEVPFGFNTSLTPGSHPEKVLNGTVVDTTRGMIRQEIYDNTDEVGGNTPNISTNGRLNGGSNHSTPFPIGGDFYLADPFIGQSGLLTVFSPTELNVGVQADAKPTAAPAGAVQVNFTGTLAEGDFIGPDSISPFVSGNALSAFIESTGETDVLRVDGQFYIAEWDGTDGTFTSNETPGVRFFLHSPLLERLEADTWRAEGESNVGTLTGLGNPISQRKKFLLPTANTYGSASLTIENGVPVSLTYTLDFAASGAPGFEGTNLEVVQFNVITLNSEGADFGIGQTFEIGVNDDDVPFGFNTSLTAGSHPEKVLNGTVVDTTRGILRKEIGSNIDEAGGNTGNISSNGRLDGAEFPSGSAPSEGDVYLADPFAGQTGLLTVFNTTQINVEVSAENSILGFETPLWASDSLSEFNGWQSFTAAFGSPGNQPDVEGSAMGASIVQSVPGAIVAGSGNLYNPATTSAFSLTHSSPTKYDTIVLQTKTAGVLDTNGVVLQYAQNGTLINLPADRSLQIASASGMFGSTFIHYWEWNVQAESISNITILFNAVGPHLSLDEVRLDTLNVSRGSAAPAGAVQVNFTGTLAEGDFIGPDSISPFVSGNALSAFIESTGETDVLRVDGQFYIAEWDGTDGTFTSNETPGVRFFLHSPLLERLEADTWRAEGESNVGTLTGLGNPISQRKKFLLPTANTYGSASLTIENGVPVSLTYTLDFAASGAPGFEGTNLEVVQFNVITLNSEGADFGIGQTFEIGVNDDDVPFGFNTSLTAGSHPEKVLNGTVVDTTRGILRKEIGSNIDEAGGNTGNISSNGRLDGAEFPSGSAPSEGDVYLADPFAGQTGLLTVFTPSELNVGVQATTRPSVLELAFVSPSELLLNINVMEGVNFQLQGTSNLTESNWVNLGRPKSGPTTISVEHKPEEFSQFFRILIIDPE